MKGTLNYFDKELKEQFIIPAFQDVTPEILREEYDDSVYRAIYAALERLATRPDWNKIPCFLMNDVIFEIDRDEYTEHYNNCLAYFTESEEFEICAHLVRLHNIL